jgi:hypothetical protein
MSADETWRTWLMTGTRRQPIDRRRVRGAHKGLKRMLVEGMSNGGDRAHSWTRFSGAMVRQAVDDGLRTLPPQQNQLIKLAYFGGLSNVEIAQRMGIKVSRVEQGLRQAVDRVSEYVERGKSAGRKAVYALILFFCGRSLVDSNHLAGAAALVAVATLAVATPASPSQVAPLQTRTVPAAVAAEPQLETYRLAAAAPSVAIEVVTPPTEVPVPPVVTLPAPLRVMLPIQLKTPPLPAPPLLHGLLGA